MSNPRYGAPMRAVVIGCGRVGSAVARQLAEEGWSVTCVDADESALSRLGSWGGGFVVGHGLELDTLHEARVEAADAVVIATGGDNTNVVLGQVIQKRWSPGCLVVRVKDPARAEFYSARGLRTVCPTSTSIEATLAALHTENEVTA